MDIFFKGLGGPGATVLTVSGGPYKPGDQPPSGYCDWHEWAAVQHKAGLRQVRCGRCLKVNFPQELSGKFDVSRPFSIESGKRVYHLVKSPICNECVK